MNVACLTGTMVISFSHKNVYLQAKFMANHCLMVFNPSCVMHILRLNWNTPVNVALISVMVVQANIKIVIMNICLHENDFKMNCCWSFFATSHGKSPCDGLGGTIKRLTARASLCRDLSQIKS